MKFKSIGVTIHALLQLINLEAEICSLFLFPNTSAICSAKFSSMLYMSTSLKPIGLLINASILPSPLPTLRLAKFLFYIHNTCRIAPNGHTRTLTERHSIWSLLGLKINGLQVAAGKAACWLITIKVYVLHREKQFPSRHALKLSLLSNRDK